MYAKSRAGNLHIGAFSSGSICQAWKPANWDGNRAAILKIDA